MKYSNNNYNKDLRKYSKELRLESVSRAEKLLWKAALSKGQSGAKFKRQRPIGNFIVDFFSFECRLIIEIDGSSHFNKPSYDSYRQEYLNKLGYKILRFKEGEVINQLDEVITKIEHAVFVLKSK
ncbi:MAG: endonuclease domain-containing protein [Crocinitomicaceae bacterium]|nr:endonuclease domain-containing protein [Crocinitomicaceae bacterium]